MTLPPRPALLGRRQQPSQQPDRRLERAGSSPCVVAGEQQPGEGDVLVLAQIRQLVVGGQPVLACPGGSVTESRRAEAGAGPVPREPAARWGSKSPL